MNRPVPTGAFAEQLAADRARILTAEKPLLCQLLETALATGDAASKHLETVDSWTDGVEEYEQDRLDAVAHASRHALLIHLQSEHGIDPALAGRFGEVL